MPRRREIRVVIADDNRAVRRGLRLQLELAVGITVIGEAGNGQDAVAVARAERADVVLMDLQMPLVGGIQATRELAGLDGDGRVSVLVLTSHPDDEFVLQALDAGASGYLLKTQDNEQLVEAIRSVHRGEGVVAARATAPVLRELARHRATADEIALASALTPAERRVVGALSSGFTTNEQLAEHLHVSVNTVRTQLHNIMKKTAIDDRTRLALWGARLRLDAPVA